MATRRNVEKASWLKEKGVTVTRDNRKAAGGEADVVFLAVKPGKVGGAVLGGEIADVVEGKLVISVVAGVSLKELKRLASAKFVRAMPNIAILARESFTAYSTDDLDGGDEVELVERLLRTFGACVRVEEEHMDAITGLSGSGPAYVTVFLEAMVYGGLRVGLRGTWRSSPRSRPCSGRPNCSWRRRPIPRRSGSGS